jgi:hypothetical protein
MPIAGYEELIYRGHYEVVCGIDFSGTMLTAEYGGGLREDEVILPPVRYWKLTYEQVNRHRMVTPDGGEPKTRENYLWDLYVGSKLNGNRPFAMRCPRNGKAYLCFFDEDVFEMTLLNLKAMTTGLSIRQTRVRGVSTLPDGSIAEAGENPSVI